MYQTIDSMLYIDPQDTIPVGFCPECGSEIWQPEGLCPRCGEEGSHDSA